MDPRQRKTHREAAFESRNRLLMPAAGTGREELHRHQIIRALLVLERATSSQVPFHSGAATRRIFVTRVLRGAERGHSCRLHLIPSQRSKAKEDGEKTHELWQNEAAAASPRPACLCLLQDRALGTDSCPRGVFKREPLSKLNFNWHTLAVGRNKEGKELVRRGLSFLPEPSLGSVL